MTMFDDRRQAGPPEPPQPVRLARAMWIAGAALGAIRAVVQLADRRSLVEQLRAGAPTLTTDQLNSMASTGIAFGLLVLGGYVALMVWLAGRMQAGAHWARVVITVWAAAELAAGGIGLIGYGSGVRPAAAPGTITSLQLLFTGAGLLIDAVLLVLLTRKESLTYFRTMRARRLRPTPPPAERLP